MPSPHMTLIRFIVNWAPPSLRWYCLKVEWIIQSLFFYCLNLFTVLNRVLCWLLFTNCFLIWLMLWCQINLICNICIQIKIILHGMQHKSKAGFIWIKGILTTPFWKLELHILTWVSALFNFLRVCLSAHKVKKKISNKSFS